MTWRVAIVAALTFFFAPTANACEPTQAWPPSAAGFDSEWRHELEVVARRASAIYWVRLNSQSTMPPIFAARLCNGSHWGNGGDGPFYCAANALTFDVRETLVGEGRGELALYRRQIGYVEVRRVSEIPCCVATENISPSPLRMSAVAMGGCGPTVLIPARSYVVALYGSGTRVQFLGPIDTAENPVLAALRD